MDAAFQGNSQDVRDWPKLDPLSPHVLAVCRFADREKKTTEKHATSRLLDAIGSLFFVKASYQEAEPLMRRALAIDEDAYGTEHPKVGIRLNNLALLLQGTNRLSEAEPLSWRMVAIFIAFGKSIGHEHPHFEAAIGNYVSLLQAMGLSESEAVAKIQSELRGEAE
jgi:hypothetical protein